MKKLTFLFCAWLCCHTAQAQLFRNGISFYEFEFSQSNNRLFANSNYQENKVKQVEVKQLGTKSNSVKKISSYLINPVGITYEFRSMDKNGKINRSYFYILIDSFRFEKRISVYKKDTFLLKNQFNDNQLITVSEYFKKQQLMTAVKYTYNNNNQIASTNYINKKGKETSRYEYKYFENGSREEMKYYKNNKLKKIYNYSCQPTGEVQKKVTQQNICKKSSLNLDSSYIEIHEGKDNKGHATTRIKKYSKDSLILEDTYLNKNDKEIRKYVYAYNNKRTKAILTYRKGKLLSTSHYQYTPTGLYSGYQVKNAKGKIKTNITYTYQYF